MIKMSIKTRSGCSRAVGLGAVGGDHGHLGGIVPRRLSEMAVFFILLLVPPFFVAVSAAAERPAAQIIARADQLPAGVQRMHRAILQAARSGEIDNMREVLQMNELMPLIEGKFIHDPVRHWKAASKDKSGREILALLTQLLELPPVEKTSKSGQTYIWPYFAGVPLDKLTAPEIVRLYRLADASKIASMLKNNHYSHFVVTIGADGTWHSFGPSPGH